jgi:hypothetical protein
MDCPQPSIIAQLVDGRLSPVEIAAIEAHLDGCSRCADLVAAAVSPGNSPSTEGARPAYLIPPGTRLGRYQVRRWIGRGGMGDVYEGFDPKLERPVAIKLLLERDSGNRSAQRRLEREAKTLARLGTPT